jgi:hypothetical protein
LGGAAVGGAAGLAVGAAAAIALPIAGIAAALAATGVGAYIGALAGALSKTERPAERDATTEHPVEGPGGPRVAICVDRAGTEPRAIALLERLGAQDIGHADGEWHARVWEDFDPRVPPERVASSDAD